MARARIGSSVQTKLNMLLFGDTGCGKSTMAMQIAYFKREDGTPFRVMVLDAESGGCEEILEELESNGIDTGNIYMVYTQSQKEIKDYIAKVRDKEVFYELDEDGNETDEVVKDAYGEDFHPDAIVLDGTSVLKLTSTQSLLDLSRKRNKVKAEKAGATGDEKFVAVANANLELKDYSQLNYAGQDLVLSLMACGVHVIMTAREKAETIQIKDNDGKSVSVNTGKFVYDSFKGMDYNTKTLVRMFRDEDGQVCASIVKDRTKVHAIGEVVEDPTLLDWQSVIEKGKGKSEFTLRNDLDNAIESDQKIFEKQMLGKESKSEPNNEVTNTSSNLDEIKVQIKAKITSLNPVEKAEMKKKFADAGLPANFNKVDDEETLNKILALVTE